MIVIASSPRCHHVINTLSLHHCHIVLLCILVIIIIIIIVTVIIINDLAAHGWGDGQEQF
jgi:hypothetical protein